MRPLGETAADLVLPEGVSAALHVLEGPGKGELIAIHGALQVGRGENNGLVIGDRNVSTLHAMIEPAGTGKFRIRDLESRNGTFVNGEKVTDRMLDDGDVVVLGSSVLKFRAAAKPTESESRPAEEPAPRRSSSSTSRRRRPG